MMILDAMHFRNQIFNRIMKIIITERQYKILNETKSVNAAQTLIDMAVDDYIESCEKMKFTIHQFYLIQTMQQKKQLWQSTQQIEFLKLFHQQCSTKKNTTENSSLHQL